MSIFAETLEVHIHGEIQLLPSVEIAQVWTALESLLKYSNAVIQDNEVENLYEFEAGIQFDSQNHNLSICWTMLGDDSAEEIIEKTCLALNPLSAKGAVLEVSFCDTDVTHFSNLEDQGELMLVYIGPTAQAIAEVQRESLVQDVLTVMERQFDVSELTAVFAEIDKLFQNKTTGLSNKNFTHAQKSNSTGLSDKFVLADKHPRRVH